MEEPKHQAEVMPRRRHHHLRGPRCRCGTRRPVRQDGERVVEAFELPIEQELDGKDTGRNSPLKGYALPAGTHRIRVVNPPSGLEKELTVTIKAAESTQQIVRLE